MKRIFKKVVGRRHQKPLIYPVKGPLVGETYDKSTDIQPSGFDSRSVPLGLRWWKQTDQERRAKYDECLAKAPEVYSCFLSHARDSLELLHERLGARQEDKPVVCGPDPWPLTDDSVLPKPRDQDTVERYNRWCERRTQRDNSPAPSTRERAREIPYFCSVMIGSHGFLCNYFDPIPGF
ncbi:hypothetical protein F5X96DRAFT_667575 [Biscogniauxia mediterranea]|nr:hypothetical protein F5X96DRAFT_667575 [Biscogniauxia mediterranea]